MHLSNLALHIAAGIAAILLGLALLLRPKGTLSHRRRGRIFVALTLTVCATGAIGNVFFRFIPLFAILTLLVTYQLLSGWHAVHTRAAGPDRIDALLLLWATGGAIALLPLLLADETGPVVQSTLAALALLLAYDAARWCFPRRWHATLWRYEHLYKMVASLSGMLSAASGNLLRIGQPWSQLLPSLLGMAVIAVCIWREHRRPTLLSPPESDWPRSTR